MTGRLCSGAAAPSRVAFSRSWAGTPSSLRVQRRYLEYWGLSVTGRTQPYAQGDTFPRLDNTKYVVDKPSATAAGLTGNPCNIAYDSENIFSVKGYSAVERDHYQPLRGITRHAPDPVTAQQAQVVSDILVRLFSVPDPAGVEVGTTNNNKNTTAGVGGRPTLRQVWWGQLLKDFPSLKTPCTPTFRTNWEVFFAKATAVAHDDAALKALAAPFLREQMQGEKTYICYAMVWRFTERLADALATLGRAAGVERHEQRLSRVVLESVTKRTLDTLADEPWAHPETTSPLNVDVSQFRAWHEAGYW